MKTFYEKQRQSLGILMDSNNKPGGGQYSFDEDNKLHHNQQIVGLSCFQGLFAASCWLHDA